MAIRMYVAFLLALLLGSPLHAQDEAEIASTLSACKWIAYGASTRNPTTGKEPTLDEIRKDLELLRQCGFTGIVTFSCKGMEQFVPQLARSVGFRGVIAGIWDPTDEEELQAAAALDSSIDGFCLGNEGVLRGEYSVEELDEYLKHFRRRVRTPVTTSEPIHLYRENPSLVTAGDWLFPIAHPYWAGIRDADEGIEWTLKEFQHIKQSASNRPVLLKEVGFPTAGAPEVNETLQLEYFQKLSKTDIAFVYFEAFDQVWKSSDPVEPHWGLFHEDRSPKTLAQQLCRDVKESKEDEIDQPSIAFLSPISRATGPCILTGDGGKIAVHGESSNLYSEDMELLLFLNPQQPSARGWYLQSGHNGINTFLPDGTWRGQAQLGNRKWPPVGGEVISIAVVALPKAEARKISEKDKPGQPLSSLPHAPKERIEVAKDVIVKTVK